MTKLFYNYSFQRRNEVSDGAGNVQSDWVEKFTRRGERAFFKGREKVIAAAETSTQEVIITVRSCSQIRSVKTSWRVVDIETGRSFNIRAIEPNDDRLYVDFLIQSGISDG